jgi:hypothetical protein
MKRLFLTLQLFFGISLITVAQRENNFDVEKFEKALIHQMEITFPGMQLDTTLRFATRATSQAEAGYPECYGTKSGGMVNTANDETAEAVQLVAAYKKYIEDVLHFDEQSLKRCRFTEFCATATAQYGGLVRYGIVIDNNITRESIMGFSTNTVNSIYQEEVELVDSLVLNYYGRQMKIDDGFDIGCENYVKEKTESKNIPWVDGQAHYHFALSSQDGMPSKKAIEETIKERFEYLDSLGLPLTISRYYIKAIVEGEMTYLILALDN